MVQDDYGQTVGLSWTLLPFTWKNRTKAVVLNSRKTRPCFLAQQEFVRIRKLYRTLVLLFFYAVDYATAESRASVRLVISARLGTAVQPGVSVDLPEKQHHLN